MPGVCKDRDRAPDFPNDTSGIVTVPRSSVGDLGEHAARRVVRVGKNIASCKCGRRALGGVQFLLGFVARVGERPARDDVVDRVSCSTRARRRPKCASVRQQPGSPIAWDGLNTTWLAAVICTYWWSLVG